MVPLVRAQPGTLPVISISVFPTWVDIDAVRTEVCGPTKRVPRANVVLFCFAWRGRNCFYCPSRSRLIVPIAVIWLASGTDSGGGGDGVSVRTQKQVVH